MLEFGCVECVMELVFREDGVRVFNLVHVWKSWCVIIEDWVRLFLFVVVFLDGSAASVLPGAEGVGGCKGADGFDNGDELCLGCICLPRAGTCMGSGVVCE